MPVEEVRLEVLDRFGWRTRQETFTVMPQHEAELRRFVAYRRGYGRVMLALVLGLVVAMLAIGTARAAALGVVGLGTVMLVFPFATPETVEWLGLRASIRLVRGLAALLVIVGLALFSA